MFVRQGIASPGFEIGSSHHEIAIFPALPIAYSHVPLWTRIHQPVLLFDPFKAFFAISKPRIRINYAGTKTVDEWAFDRWEQWLIFSNAPGPKTVFGAKGIRIYRKIEGNWKIYWSIQTDDELVGSEKTSITDQIK